MKLAYLLFVLLFYFSNYILIVLWLTSCNDLQPKGILWKQTLPL